MERISESKEALVIPLRLSASAVDFDRKQSKKRRIKLDILTISVREIFKKYTSMSLIHHKREYIKNRVSLL